MGESESPAIDRLNVDETIKAQQADRREERREGGGGEGKENNGPPTKQKTGGEEEVISESPPYTGKGEDNSKQSRRTDRRRTEGV